MNILELYEQGYTKFKFSDGVTREVNKVDYGRPKDSLRFDLALGGGVGPRIWYYNETGVPNIRPHEFPRVTGVEGMNNRRDDIQQAIEQGVSNAAAPISDDDYNEIVVRVLHELDELVERWTDEETAEDLSRGKPIKHDEVYEGMRVRMLTQPEDEEPPVGATGTIILPDIDYAPGVKFDSPWDGWNTSEGRDEAHGEMYLYVSVSHMEEIQ